MDWLADRIVSFHSRVEARALILLAIAAAVSAGAETHEIELEGKYLRASNVVFERIEITGMEFLYNRGTDEIDDPWGEGFPIRGRIQVEGDIVTLVHPRLGETERQFRIVDEGRHTYLVRLSDLVDDADLSLEEIGLRKFKKRSIIKSK